MTIAGNFEHQRVAAIAVFLDLYPGSRCDAAKGAGGGFRHSRDVIEGKDTIAQCKRADDALAWRERSHRRGHGVEKPAQQASDRSFAAAWRAVEDQDRVGAGGLEGGENPGCQGLGKRAGWRIASGRGGLGKRELASCAAENEARCECRDLDAAAVDLDGFAIGIGEVDVEGVRLGADAESSVVTQRHASARRALIASLSTPCAGGVPSR